MTLESITLHIRLGTSIRLTIPSSQSSSTITLNSTILDVKTLIAQEEACDHCPVERQRLIYKGRILSDDSRTLSDYGVVGDNQTLHLVKGSAARSTTGGGTTPTSSGTTSGGTSTTTTHTETNAPSGTGTTSGSSGSNPFLMMQQMMQQQNNPLDTSNMQQQLLQNPEMMSSILNSPMMQSMVSNPDFIRTMMESNPEMRTVLDNNPQLRHILDDPELMRRSMEMMRDPAAMQNMMRNQDLAMSQIENVPGGFNALRRMYEEVQEPMMDAMAGSGTGNAQSANNSGNNTGGASASGTAMPNPWGSSTTGSSSTSTSTDTSTSNPIPNLFANPWGEANQPHDPHNPSSAGGGATPNPLWTGGIAGQRSGGPPNMNLEQTISMLENPLINTMMQQMMSDPQALQSMMDNNPMLQQMRQSNPAAAAMMSNPETLRAMMDPQNLRAMMQIQQSMQQLGTNVPGFPMMPGASPSTGTPSSSSPQQNLDFSSLLHQFQNTSVSSPSAPQQRQQSSPEERFRHQLTSLNNMGFTDREANIRALTETHGNINRAVERLLDSPPPPS